MSALVKAFVLLPACTVVIGALGLSLSTRFPKTGRTVAIAALLGLLILSTPWSAGSMAGLVERYPPIDIERIRNHDVKAIVVLGGGSYQGAPEFNGRDDVSSLTLERLRYGAHLHRELGFDLAVTGGTPHATRLPEGESMKIALERDFRVPVKWVETKSRNTAENASYTARLINKGEIILVTHAVHMPRAVGAFEHSGFTVVPAPMAFISGRGNGFVASDLLPDIRSLARTNYALYEILGATWYRLTRS